MKRTVLFLMLLVGAVTISFAQRRVLYIGDSVTDGGWGRSGGSAAASANRNHSDLNHLYGHSYMMLCAARYMSMLPEAGYEFINRGISGDDISRLEVRWEEDAVSLRPDVLSLLIGTNDVNYYLERLRAGSPTDVQPPSLPSVGQPFDLQGWEQRYRLLLDRVREASPQVRFVLGTPFVAKVGRVGAAPDFALRDSLVHQLSAIVSRIASDYDAVLLRYDSLFAAQNAEHPLVPASNWIWDGIHPTAAGHQLMANLWMSRCGELMRSDNRVTISVTREQLEQCPDGPYEASWQSIAAHYHTPEWFMDAKFGIFIHWGLYSVPATGSEWYPKHMYNGLSRVHRSNWGSQSQFGYKDFIPLFRAENFDPQQWAELFKEAGARYVIPTAEHHDGFAMYDSRLTRWNAKQMGPQRDIIGELAEAVRSKGMKFGVSNHRIENWDFMYPLSMPQDSTDLFLPQYADFYGPPQKPTAQSAMGPRALAAAAGGGATEAVINEAALEGHHPQSDAFLNEWELRVHEIIDRYQPDLLYFDNGINYRSLDPWKLRLARYYYNSAYQWQKEVSIQSKAQAYLAGSIQDFERESRAPRQPFDRYWQVDDPIGNKFGYVEGLRLQSADGIIRNLVDNVACGGNLCLNISPRGDGTIPDDQQQILRTIGQWLQVNGEGIYGTRPYHTAIERQQGGDATMASANIRFTQKDNAVYAFVLRWDGRPFTIKSIDDSKVKTVTMLASGKKVRFQRLADGGISVAANGSATNSAAGFRIIMK